MNAPGYEADPEALAAHAKVVADLAVRVARARDAVNEVGVGGFEHYGALCSSHVGAHLRAHHGDFGELAESAAKLGASLAEALGHTATDYRRLDADVAAQVKKLGDARDKGIG